ncbi:hypothetical protein EUX98_g3005 [Antrodiella citrinella]|uniref:Elongation factor-like 1 n=1 Tax=Antrodiella citrinella TaxID=2447956 RepID=A0A4S4N0F6_9APHY|nr:hypothetical protein EUX98_g3005 [Antrodiella citrinella]
MERSAEGGTAPRTYVVNMIDTPGHVDFSSEVSTASRLCDGALVLVDAVEGVCTQTITVLRQAWQDRLKPILVINKFDRLITELQLAPIEAYHHLVQLIEQVNAVMGSFFAGERMEDDLRWREERERRLAEKRESLAEEVDAAADDADEFQEKDDEDIYFAPEKGNVIFASAMDGWGFRIGKFAHLYAVKLKIKEANLRTVLWGDFYLDPKTKRIMSHKHLRGRTLKPLFVQFVLENIWAVYDAVSLNPDPEKVTKIVNALNLKIPLRDLKTKDTRHLLSLIFSQWLSLSTCVIQTIVDIVPPPTVAQRTRIPKMLYPDIYEPTVEPQNKLEKGLYRCDDGSDAGVVALVSKMFAVSAQDLPQNKRQPVTADDLRNRAKVAREAKQAAEAVAEATDALADVSIEASDPPPDAKDTEADDEAAPPKEAPECLLGFARIYSGTIVEGSSICCILPKYNHTLGPSHPRNVGHLVTATVESLYVMMGRELVQVPEVTAGNVFAIKGLEGKVWRNATLCAPSSKGVGETPDLDSLNDCLLNLGGVIRTAPPIVRVALEPAIPADMPKLVNGLKLLAQADPCVETFQQQTGEYVILTAGELHLERCLKDLRERFAKIEIHASKPIVPFRETVVKGIDMAPPKSGGKRGVIHGATVRDLVKFTIRAVPLPQEISKFLLDNLAILRQLERERSSKASEQTTVAADGDIEDEVDLQGEIIKRQTIKPEDFWSALTTVCEKVGGEWLSIQDKLIAFGPQRAGTCLLCDGRNKGTTYSLKSELDGSDDVEESRRDVSQVVRDLEKHLETGFQLATFQGPLCAEPVEGVAYFLESLEVDLPGIEEEQEHNRMAQVTGSFISAVRDACRNGLLDWSPRLMLAMYECDIQASTDVLGKVYGVVARRRGRIVAEEMKEGTSFFLVRALLPVVESFGFADDIRKRTSGAASPQLIFSGYEMLDEDPFWVPTTEEELEDLGEKADRSNVAKGYMDGVRERKGMFVDRKIVEFAEKQRTLKRVNGTWKPTLLDRRLDVAQFSRVSLDTVRLVGFVVLLVVVVPFLAVPHTRFGLYCTRPSHLPYILVHGALPQPAEEQYISTFFCRALYDYQTRDASSLSFHKSDIIEVLTQLESGWWDGLLGDERGWFPSNYVVVISEQEAETALAATAPEFSQTSSMPSLPDESVLDMSQALGGSSSDANWLEADDGYNASQHAVQQAAQPEKGREREGHHNDFWVPRVSQDGRIFYVNTQTGQHSQDLPHEAEEGESDISALSPSSSRASPGPVGALASTSPLRTVRNGGAVAGFGLPRRSRTPESWVRRLADDGLSYYYQHTETGQISWSPPSSEVEEAPPPAYTSAVPGNRVNGNERLHSSSNSSAPPGRSTEANRMRSDSTVSHQTRDRSDSVLDRASVYSDDSDVHPFQRSRAASSASMTRHVNGNARTESMQTTSTASGTRISLTPSEQVAQALQKALASPPPQSPVELSDHVREAIDSVVEYLQSTGISRTAEEASQVDARVLGVVTTVRNLLYVTATPSGHIPSHLYPRSQDGRTGIWNQALQSHLKASHRKVAGTLSKLVLSALAMQYDPVLSVADKPNRMESDATELERSVAAFVLDVQRFREQNASSRVPEIKRLRGAFATTNIGLGLPGAGVAGHWRGFGYVPVESTAKPPSKTFSGDVVTMLKLSAGTIETKLRGLMVISHNAAQQLERFQTDGHSLLGYLATFLINLNDFNIAQHVDIDGVQANSPQYLQTVDKARILMRTLEASVQALFDDSISLLMMVEAHRAVSIASERERVAQYEYVDALLTAVRSNLGVVIGVLDALVAVGHDQADIGQQSYRNSIEWRRSRISIVDGNINGTAQPMVQEDVVDMELAFSNPGPSRNIRALDTAPSALYNASSQYSESSLDMSDGAPESMTPTWQDTAESATLLGSQHSPTAESFILDEVLEESTAGPASSKTPPRAAKLIKLLGNDAPQHYITKLNEDAKPWYLRPNYDQSEILIDPDGGVRAGTTSALVERLTAHETGDPTFIKYFLMTFKSFMTLNELFDLLVHRFWVQPPENLSNAEMEEWTKLKQHVIRMRVLNVFKSMVTDDDVLEPEDMYILDRMKDFAVIPDVHSFAAAKQLVILIERAQRNGDGPIKTTNTAPVAPPAPIMPKASKKLKLLDLDPTELARQLTLMEAALYKKIRPMECLQRSRDSKPGKSVDNITGIIQMSNRMANWVAETILDREDSRKRAAIVKHFINVAERCRLIQNFSTMVAIISGLNTPPIRRLKRTWEQVNARFMTLLGNCEQTIDTNKNFTNYRQALATITPPCVPFIGVYLTTLTFINDGAEDKLAGQMVNFRKRQKAAEVIQDIKRWQAKPYNFTIVTPILNYLEDALHKYSDGVDYGDKFWELSLQREPREREDEKMARLLQESGFL